MAENKDKDEDKDLEDLKNLPPAERIKKLKEFEEKRKKEIEKAETLLENSLDEIKKSDERREEEEGLAEEDQERESKSIEDDENLEETVKKTTPKIPEELLEQQTQYTNAIKQLTSHDMYDNLQRWAGQAEQGTLASEYEDVITELYQKVNDEYLIMKNVHEEATKRYESSDDMLDKLISARKVLKDIGYKTNWFRRG